MTSQDLAAGEESPLLSRPVILPWEDDRRVTDRRTFLNWQHVAWGTAIEVPRSKDFQRVRCLDLSPYGISFLLDQEPVTTTMIVAFGDPVNGTFVAAEIACIEGVIVEDQLIYRIGCRFQGQRFTRKPS